uniref:Uncharacterized protein n=1 Tax=Tanacetum cinerariifolium TaxID=118510 RepID=A0A699L6G5_TANCI|nr:hypothetical protein [Tanacetum cinerariifolium]
MICLYDDPPFHTLSNEICPNCHMGLAVRSVGSVSVMDGKGYGTVGCRVKALGMMYTTPLALKVSIVDYQIHHEHNKPFYKIIKADGTHQLFLSFITLLRNFDIKDLEMLWKLVQERFQSSDPKNFSDNFLLNTFKIMFEKPNVEASIWRDQRGRYGLAKVKSWKLFESCGVHHHHFHNY